MNLALEFPDHAPEPESLAEGNFCPLLPQEALDGTDDMAGICDATRNLLARAHAQQRLRRWDSGFMPLI